MLNNITTEIINRGHALTASAAKFDGGNTLKGNVDGIDVSVGGGADIGFMVIVSLVVFVFIFMAVKAIFAANKTSSNDARKSSEGKENLTTQIIAVGIVIIIVAVFLALMAFSGITF